MPQTRSTTRCAWAWPPARIGLRSSDEEWETKRKGLRSKQAKRSGLRVHGSRGNPDVCAALIRFAKWLRDNYEFPIRVPVYLGPRETITSLQGEEVAASFFAPFDRNIEPYIRIATGDYSESKEKDGRDNALASFLASLAHEVIHYQQWISGGHAALSEHGVSRKARRVVDRYALTVDHP